MPKLSTSQLEAQYLKQMQFNADFREKHSFYGFVTGRVQTPSQCSKFDITDPNCEILLETAKFFTEDAAACFKERCLQMFYNELFTPDDLINSIREYTRNVSKSQQYLQQYISLAQSRIDLFCEIYRVDKKEAFGCCLALSFYTGIYSERINRDECLEVRISSIAQQSVIKNADKFGQVKCISHWLYRALHYIPLHWGQVTRCISLDESQQKAYEVGSIFTWLQFSSSTYGQITSYFAKRNTRFIIYSLSGRCIQKFSNYGSSERQVLFKPYSHFLILKKIIVKDKLHIYMRQIFIGQSQKNILWVDDNIFNSQWENKKIMENAMLVNPFLGIVPKISTETAIAFITSHWGKNRNKQQFRIISDMTRSNENKPHNAGARFIKLLSSYYKDIPVLIFTSNKAKAEQYLKQLGVNYPGLKISVITKDAMKFLEFA